MSKPLIDIEGILLSAISKMPKETETIDVCQNMVIMAASQAQFMGMSKEDFLEAVGDTWDYVAESGLQESYLEGEIH
jgi:hypothetical protein